MTQPTKIDASCGVVPVRLEGRRRLYLLVRHHKGHWGFPKGHAHEDETPQQAAMRELFEETGLTVERLIERPAFVEEYHFRSKKGSEVRKTVTYFVGLVSDQPVRIHPEEIIDYAWGDAEQALARLTFEESQHLLRRVEGFLRTYLLV